MTLLNGFSFLLCSVAGSYFIQEIQRLCLVEKLRVTQLRGKQITVESV